MNNLHPQYTFFGRGNPTLELRFTFRKLLLSGFTVFQVLTRYIACRFLLIFFSRNSSLTQTLLICLLWCWNLEADMCALFCSHLLWLLVHCKHLTHSQGHSDFCKFLYLIKPWPTKELSQAIQVSHQSQNPAESASFLSCDHISIWPSVFGCQTQSLLSLIPHEMLVFLLSCSLSFSWRPRRVITRHKSQSIQNWLPLYSLMSCSLAGLWQFFFIACLKVVFTHFKKFHCWLIPS